MKERQILFSAPMVRAILEGRKTQTRRVVRKQFAQDAEPAEVPATSPEGWQISGHSGLWWDDTGACIDDAIRCPYGHPGDRLWVRETFQPLFADGVENHWGTDWKTGKGYKVSYPATDGIQEFINLDDELSDACKPSIHMPRWASRITLEITGVRIERLNDISEVDAKDEGAMYHDGRGIGHSGWRHDYKDVHANARSSFARLWEEINGDGSWKANPWVWVVEFKRLKGGEA